jgi:chromosomal replication initiation ATPase DnaA
MDKIIDPNRKFNVIVNPQNFQTHSEEYIINLILQLVTEWYKVDDVQMLASKSRQQLYVPARHVSIALIRRYTRYSLKAIGELYKRDHTSVVHARDTLKDACDTQDPILYPAWKYVTDIMSDFPIINH